MNLAQFQIRRERKQFSALKCPSSRGWGNLKFILFFFRFSLLDSSPALVSLGLLSILQVLPSSALRFSSSSDNGHRLPAGVTHWLGAFAVFVSLVEAPSHSLQPAVRHFFMDCPLTSLSFWKPGSVTHAHFLLFFSMSHLLSVSPFPVPPIILYYFFPLVYVY